MASGEASSGMILFVAAMAVAGIAAAALTTVVNEMSTELRDRGQGLAQALGTDLAIVNDPDNVPYSGGELTLYIKNTGSANLVDEELMVLVDGVNADFTATLSGGETTWSTGVVAELTVTVTLSGGDHTVRVVHTPNAADSMDFRV